MIYIYCSDKFQRGLRVPPPWKLLSLFEESCHYLEKAYNKDHRGQRDFKMNNNEKEINKDVGM